MPCSPLHPSLFSAVATAAARTAAVTAAVAQHYSVFKLPASCFFLALACDRGLQHKEQLKLLGSKLFHPLDSPPHKFGRLRYGDTLIHCSGQTKLIEASAATTTKARQNLCSLHWSPLHNTPLSSPSPISKDHLFSDVITAYPEHILSTPVALLIRA